MLVCFESKDGFRREVNINGDLEKLPFKCIVQIPDNDIKINFTSSSMLKNMPFYKNVAFVLTDEEDENGLAVYREQ